jgi:hypothetical protein
LESLGVALSDRPGGLNKNRVFGWDGVDGGGEGYDGVILKTMFG